MVDIENEIAGSEGLRAIEDLIAHGSSRRESFLGYKHAELRDLAAWNQYLGSAAANLIGHIHAVEFGHDDAIVVRVGDEQSIASSVGPSVRGQHSPASFSRT